MDFATADSPVVLLLDNGSLQPAATLCLRRLAGALQARAGVPVHPVSLLHSSSIDPAALGGTAAEILEPALRRRYADGARRFVILPLFFGPSAALTEYIPGRIRLLAEALPGISVVVGRPLVDISDSADTRLARILADQVEQTVRRYGFGRPWVILVDHGSPQPAVASVRNHVGSQLATVLGPSVSTVVAASMERREGDAYAFNEPLLCRALDQREGDGVVALLFFSPGRHAGPGGDIVTICAAAQARRADLRIQLTPLVGEHPGVVEILADRLRELL